MTRMRIYIQCVCWFLRSVLLNIGSKLANVYVRFSALAEVSETNGSGDLSSECEFQWSNFVF